MWYHRVIGSERCPIVDTWWQTETGGHMITPQPAATRPSPAHARFPPRHNAAIDENGEELPGTEDLVVRKPWPSMSASMVTGIGSSRPTGHRSTACTPPATVHDATNAATSGSWVASTT